MKKIFTLIFTIFLILCPITLSGCSQKSSIDMSAYYKPAVSTEVLRNKTYNSKTLYLSTLTSSSVDITQMDKYTSFELNAISSNMHKMFIEKIEFCIISNEKPFTSLSLNLTITNLAKEDDLAGYDDFEMLIEHKEDGWVSKKYIIPINQVVATATTSKITIQTESTELFTSNPDNENYNGNKDFKYLIYDFQIFGESREYSK